LEEVLVLELLGVAVAAEDDELREGEVFRGGLKADAQTVEAGEELLFALAVALGEVEHDHAGEEVGPEEGLVGAVLVGVEEQHLLAVLALDLVGGHADEPLAAPAEQPTRRLLLLAHQEVQQEALPHLPRTHHRHDVQRRVGLVQRQEVLELLAELQLARGLVGGEDADDAVAGLGGGSAVVEDGVALEVVVDLDGGERVVAAVVEEGQVVAAVTLLHSN
jgi:hypothetical protein